MSRYQVHQTDQNEPMIRAFLEAHGATVKKIHQPVDLLIFYRGAVALAEVKMPSEPLRASQDAFLRTWPGLWAILVSEVDCRWLLSVMTPQKPRESLPMSMADSLPGALQRQSEWINARIQR